MKSNQNGGKLALLDGIPTLIGGYNEDLKLTNDVFYQYHWNADEWIPHPYLKMNIPRYHAAVFPVPKYIFGIC